MWRKQAYEGKEMYVRHIRMRGERERKKSSKEVYFFFSIIMLVDIYDFYFRIESFHPLMLINVFISIVMLIIGLSKKDFKIKNYSKMFITVTTIYGIYQAYLFGILLPQVSSLNSSSAADIIFMPFL